MRRYLASIVAAVILMAAVSAHAQSTAAQLAESGWRAVQAGDGDRAASAFREALTLHPRDAVLNLGAGVAAHLQGRERDASTFLQAALQIEPALTPASALLGEIAYNGGELAVAIKTYEAALTRAPNEYGLRQRLEQWKQEAAATSSFETVKDDRFTVAFDGPVVQKLAERATTVLGDAFWRVGKLLGSYPSAPINVVLYTTRQFRDITGAPEWAGGGFDGQIRMPVRGALQNLPEFDRVLAHELTHAMLHSIARRNVPAWLHEGLAMRVEGYNPATIERALATRRLFVPLTALRTSFTRLNSDQATVAYAESFFVVDALLTRIDQPGLAALLQDLDGGQTIEQAVQRFGFTMDDFEASLARRVGVSLNATP